MLASIAVVLAKVEGLSTPATNRMHKVEVGKLGIDIVMCDEAHQLKNAEAQGTQAVAGLATKRRLLISGERWIRVKNSHVAAQRAFGEMAFTTALSCPLKLA